MSNVNPDFTEVSLYPKYTLGAVRFASNGKKYRYIKLVDLSAAVNKCLVAATSGDWDVTNDVDGGGSPRAGLQPIGMTIAAIPIATPYGWVQIAGIASYVAGSAAIIDGDYLMPDTENGDLTEATAAGAAYNVVGISLGIVADNATGSILLTGLPQ